MSDTIKPVAWMTVAAWGTSVELTPPNFGKAEWKAPVPKVLPLYTADALRQARDDALEEAAQWMREAGVPFTAEQMLHELKEKRDE